MTRHGELVRLTLRLLEAVGVSAEATGGPATCCGSPKEPDARINAGMARRTVEAFNAGPARQVATWCPSCHMNMQDFMAPATPTNFETLHVTEVLHARREALRPLLRHAVPSRVMLHRHHGFDGRVPVNRMVAELLALIPGITLTEQPPLPAHMCFSFQAIPGALAKAQRATLDAMAAVGAETLATIFHSCHREGVNLERNHPIRVKNWVHLLAESAGWDYQDNYRDWRNGAAVPEAAREAAGAAVFEKLVAPELARPPLA
jgi:Fe-S oxidoreductase